jgi:hypothetical protein
VDSGIVTALAALAGSVIGGMTTFATTWITQRHQVRRERVAGEIAKREALYGEFINEATSASIDAIEHEIDSLSSLTKLFALYNRIRLTSTEEVFIAADGVIHQIAELYMGGNKTPRELYEEALRNHTEGVAQFDPMRVFSEACRRELQNWT